MRVTVGRKKERNKISPGGVLIPIIYQIYGLERLGSGLNIRRQKAIDLKECT